MLNREDFAKALKEAVENEVAERDLSYVIEEVESLKVNHTLKGISFRQVDPLANVQIAPIFYLDDYYGDYRNGVDIVDIAARLVYSAMKHENKKDDVKFDVWKTRNFVIANVVPVVVGLHDNQHMLREMVYDIVYDDILVLYRVIALLQGEKICSYTLRADHLDYIETTKDEIRRHAMQNMDRILGFQVNTMEDVLKSMLAEEPGTFDISDYETVMMKKHPMYIYTNRRQLLGAAVILYPDRFKYLADKLESDLYILPSSIHEVIAVPVTDTESTESLANMVDEINNMYVNTEDRLTSSVYKYSREFNKITRVQTVLAGR